MQYSKFFVHCTFSSCVYLLTKHSQQSLTLNYNIFRVHSGLSLVKNCDLLENRRTLTPFQRQANHSNFRIIDSQWRALFCVDHDHVKWRAKVFASHYKAYCGNIFSRFNYIKQIDNILPLSVQL